MNPLKIFNAMLNVSPRVGGLLAGGLLFLASAAIVISWQIDLEHAVRTAGVILAFSVLAVIFSNITGLIARLLAWIGFGLLTSYAVLIFAQFVCTSCMTPPIRPIGCLVAPFEKGCLETTVAVNQAVIPTAPPAPTPTAATTTETAALESPVTRSINTPTVQKPRVFLHFAGDVDPKRMTTIAAELDAEGWDVQEAEAVASAFGLNEVRLFHDTDVELAKKLAGDLAKLWKASDSIAVKSLANTKFKAPQKQLEIWISK